MILKLFENDTFCTECTVTPRVSAYVQRAALGQDPPPDAAFDALLQDALPAASAGPDDGWYRECPSLDTDCIAWATVYSSNLEALAVKHALRLQRYEHVLSLHRFEDQDPVALEPPPLVMDGSTARLHLDLIARDLAHEHTRHDAIARLRKAARFWRGVGEQGRSLVAKSVADRMLERIWSLGSGVAERLPPEQLQVLEPQLRSLLAPLDDAYLDFESPLRLEFQSIAHALESEAFQPSKALGRCLLGRSEGCLSEFGGALAFFPQSTRNLLAASGQADVELLEAAPGDYLAMREGHYAETIRSLHPALSAGDFVSVFRDTNPTGRILAFVARPALALPESRLDMESLRRLHLMKLEALAQRIGAQGMPAYLESLPAERRDPYRGTPILWDEALQELAIVPLSSRWQRAQLTVPLHGIEPNGVFDCSAAVHLQLRPVGSDQESEPAVNLVACSKLGLASHVDEFEDPNDERWAQVWRYGPLVTTVVDGKLDLRLLWRDEDTRIRAFEGRRIAIDGEYHALQPRGHDASPMVELRALPATGADRIGIRVQGMPILDLVKTIERIKRVELRDLPSACARSPFTANFGAIEIERLVEFIADECGRWPRLIAPSVYRFERHKPAATP